MLPVGLGFEIYDKQTGNMSISRTLLKREHGMQAGRRQLLAHLELQGECSGTVLVNHRPGHAASPATCAQYCKDVQGGKLLALAGQEGFISVIDASSPSTIPEHLLGSANERRPVRHWEAHNNMIHDLTWAKGDTRIYTGSSDRTLAAWDVATTRRIATCLGHTGSVKTLSAHDAGDVVASGSKDGSVLLWDMRTPGRKEAVWRAEAAHAAELSSTGKRGRKGPEPAPIHVSSVAFLPGSTALASASGGPRDSVVKYWDLRKATAPLHLFSPASTGVSSATATPCGARGVAATPGAGGRGTPKTPRTATARRSGASHDELGSFNASGPRDTRHGILSLSVAPQGHQLLVSCVDGSFRLFDIKNPHLGPRAVFAMPNTDAPLWTVDHRWFIRTAFSPDGDYFLSGAADSNAYIYEVGRPDKAPVCLAGHEKNVGGVAWSRTDPMQVATCGDDCTVRIWGLQLSRPVKNSDEGDHVGVAHAHPPVAAVDSHRLFVAPPEAQQTAAPQRASPTQPAADSMFTPPPAARTQQQRLDRWQTPPASSMQVPTLEASAQPAAMASPGAGPSAPAAATPAPAPAGVSARGAAAAAAIARLAAWPGAPNDPPSTSGAGAAAGAGFVTPATAARPPRAPTSARAGTSGHGRSSTSRFTTGLQDAADGDGMPEGGGESPGAAAVASILKMLSPPTRAAAATGAVGSTEEAGGAGPPANGSQAGPSSSGAGAMDVDSPGQHAPAEAGSSGRHAPWYLAGTTATGSNPIAEGLPEALFMPPRLRVVARRGGPVHTGADEEEEEEGLVCGGHCAGGSGESPVAPSQLAVALAGAAEPDMGVWPHNRVPGVPERGTGAGPMMAASPGPGPEPSQRSEDIDFDAEFDNKENIAPPAGNPPASGRRLSTSPPSARAPAAAGIAARSPRSAEGRSPRSAESRSPRALDSMRSPRALEGLRSPRALDVRSPRAAEVAAARRLSGGSSLASALGASGGSVSSLRRSPSGAPLLGQAVQPLAPVAGSRPPLTAAAVPVVLQTLPGTPASPRASLGFAGLPPLRAPSALTGPMGPFGLTVSPRVTDYALLPPSPRLQQRPSQQQLQHAADVQAEGPVPEPHSDDTAADQDALIPSQQTQGSDVQPTSARDAQDMPLLGSQEGGTTQSGLTQPVTRTLLHSIPASNAGSNAAPLPVVMAAAPHPVLPSSQPSTSQQQQEQEQQQATGLVTSSLARLGSTAASPAPKAPGVNTSSSPATAPATTTVAGAAAYEPLTRGPSVAEHLAQLAQLLEMPVPGEAGSPCSSPASGHAPTALHRPQALPSLAPAPSSSPTRRAAAFLGVGGGLTNSAVASPNSPRLACATFAHAWRQQTATPSLLHPVALPVAAAPAASGAGYGCVSPAQAGLHTTVAAAQQTTAGTTAAGDVEMGEAGGAHHSLSLTCASMRPTVPAPAPSSTSPHRARAMINPFASAQRRTSPAPALSLSQPRPTTTTATGATGPAESSGTAPASSQVMMPGRLPGGGILRLGPAHPAASNASGAAAASVEAPAALVDTQLLGVITDTGAAGATSQQAAVGKKHAADGEVEGVPSKRARISMFGVSMGAGWGIPSASSGPQPAASGTPATNNEPPTTKLKSCGSFGTSVARFFPTISAGPSTLPNALGQSHPAMPSLPPPPPPPPPARAAAGQDPLLSPAPQLVQVGHVAFLQHTDSAPMTGPHQLLIPRTAHLQQPHHSMPAPNQLTPPRPSTALPPMHPHFASDGTYTLPSRPSASRLSEPNAGHGLQQQGQVQGQEQHDAALATPLPPPRSSQGAPPRPGARPGAHGQGGGEGGMWGSPVHATPKEHLVARTPATGPSPFSCFATASEGSFRAPSGSGRGSGRSTAGRRSSPFPSILHTASKNAAPSPAILMTSASGGSVAGPRGYHHHQPGGVSGLASFLAGGSGTSGALGTMPPQGTVVAALTMQIGGQISLPQMLPPKFPAPTPASGASGPGAAGAGSTPGSGSAQLQSHGTGVQGSTTTTSHGGVSSGAGALGMGRGGPARGGSKTLRRSRSHAFLTALTMDTAQGGVGAAGGAQGAGRPSPMVGYAGMGLSNGRLPPVHEDSDLEEDEAHGDEVLESCSEVSEGAASAGRPAAAPHDAAGPEEVLSARSPGMLSPAVGSGSAKWAKVGAEAAGDVSGARRAAMGGLLGGGHAQVAGTGGAALEGGVPAAAEPATSCAAGGVAAGNSDVEFSDLRRGQGSCMTPTAAHAQLTSRVHAHDTDTTTAACQPHGPAPGPASGVKDAVQMDTAMGGIHAHEDATGQEGVGALSHHRQLIKEASFAIYSGRKGL